LTKQLIWVIHFRFFRSGKLATIIFLVSLILVFWLIIETMTVKLFDFFPV